MKTLLVLAEHPDLAEAVRAGLDSAQYRIVHRSTLEEAEPLLVHGLADLCILDVDLTNVQGAWSIERLRRRAPKCPVIIYTTSKQWEWEEEAYLQGATHVLTKPVRIRMLTALLERLWETTTPAVVPPPAAAMPAPLPDYSKTFPTPMSSQQAAVQGLGSLRGFSAILTHSLDAEAMLKQFLLL